MYFVSITKHKDRPVVKVDGKNKNIEYFPLTKAGCIAAGQWLYIEKQSPEKISNHAFYTFWYVLPTLPMFLAFPKIYHKFGFFIAMASSILITILCFIVTSQLLKKFNIHLY